MSNTIKPSIETWDEVSQNYSLEINESEVEISEYILDVFKKLKISSTNSIIELGSGSGHLSALLAQQNFQPTLLDFSPVAISKSKDLFDQKKLSAKFIQEDIFNLDKIPKFDVAWNSGVMEHFDDDNLAKVLKKIYDQTNDYFVFLVPNPDSVSYLIWRYGLIADNKWPYGYEFLRKDYCDFLTKTGFKIVSKQYLGSKISRWQFSSFVKNNLELNKIDDLINNQLLPSSNSYLVAYICSKKAIADNENPFKSAKWDAQEKTDLYEKLGVNFSKKYSQDISAAKDQALLDQNIIEESKKNTLKLMEEINRLIDENKKTIGENLKTIKDKEKIIKEKDKVILGKDTIIAECNTKINSQETKINEQFTVINKIYHSKMWRMLGLYKQIIGTTKKIAKKVVPLRLRKNIKSQIEAVVVPKLPDSIIAQQTKNEWQKYSDTRGNNQLDILNFCVIAWDFRFQRPQQIAVNMAKLGHRVFYIKNEFLPQKDTETFLPIKVDKKSDNAYEVILSATRNLFIYSDVPTEKDKQMIIASIKSLIREANIINPIAKIDHPFWANIMSEMGMPVIYDCMDNHQGFSDNGKETAALEQKLFKESDITLVSSEYLRKLAKKHGAKNITLIRNAGDYEHFQTALSGKLSVPSDIAKIPHPILGYYGAIADWFDTKILEDLAKQHSDKSIVLIGNVTNKEVESIAKKYPNVYLLGEKPYQELPSYLAQFDVCLIPFVINELIKATHPVKIYEYLAAGKPVVTTKMPEILDIKDDIFYSDSESYSKNVSLALAQKNKNIKSRQKVAFNNTWVKRAQELEVSLLSSLFPKVSAVILSYNHPDLMKKTLDSVLNRSLYPNLEIVIVDNASDTETIKLLKSYPKAPNLNIIYSSINTGFAKGNNIGLKATTGEYLILLNNDVIVTPGWVSRLLFHAKKKNVGLVGPVTNSIGNEAKINIEYDVNQQSSLEQKALEYTSAHWNQTMKLHLVAAYCWIMSRDLYKKLGGLDERYGRGMFEDDDYCASVHKEGLDILCADDVFIHHFGGSSFKQIQSAEFQKLFQDNQLKFEKKWHTKWTMHQYRKTN